jgi:hypothetical protein
MIIRRLEGMGATCAVSSDVLAGILRALLMAAMHADEIGEPIFEKVMDRIFLWVGQGLVQGAS